MKFDVELYHKLDKIRQRIKYKGKLREGRAPTVCTDEALNEIVRLLPQTEAEFLCVPGLGQKFVDSYAAHFIPAIKNHVAAEVPKGQHLSTSARETLKELEKKLININRRNRLLYMPKISNKHAYDLFDPDDLYDPMDIIIGGKQ